MKLKLLIEILGKFDPEQELRFECQAEVPPQNVRLLVWDGKGFTVVGQWDMDKTHEVIHLTRKAVYKDGGSTDYIGSDGRKYYELRMIGMEQSPRYGYLFRGTVRAGGDKPAVGYFQVGPGYDGKVFDQRKSK